MTQTTTSAIILRPYQSKCLDAIYDHEAQGIRRQIIALPTGTGKTIVFCSLIADRTDGHALVLVHRQELIEQTVAKLQAVGVEDIGVIQADRNEFDHRVLVASVQTLSRENRLAQLPKDIPLLIVDECHHAIARTWSRIIDHTGCGERDNSLLLGFSATPERFNAKAEKRHLADIFEKITFSYSIQDAIADGWLVSPRGIHISLDVDLDVLTKVGGDFTGSSLEDAMQRANAPADIVAGCVEHAHGRSTVAFCATVAAAHALRDEFRSWPRMSVAVTSGKVALLIYKTMTSRWTKSSVPKTIMGAIPWHIDFGTACGTVSNPLKEQIIGSEKGCRIRRFLAQLRRQKCYFAAPDSFAHSGPTRG